MGAQQIQLTRLLSAEDYLHPGNEIFHVLLFSPLRQVEGQGRLAPQWSIFSLVNNSINGWENIHQESGGSQVI